MPPQVRDRFRKGFEKSCDAGRSFGPAGSDPGLVLVALAIEGNGMKFHPKAFKETLDFSELEYYPKTQQETISDIKRIYRHIVSYERWIKGKRSTEGHGQRQGGATQGRVDVTSTGYSSEP